MQPTDELQPADLVRIVAEHPGESFWQYQRGLKLSPRLDSAAPDLGAFMNNP
jgi:hypothetical protein